MSQRNRASPAVDENGLCICEARCRPPSNSAHGRWPSRRSASRDAIRRTRPLHAPSPCERCSFLPSELTMPGGFLPSVLQSIKAQVGHPRCFRMRNNRKNSAFFFQFLVPRQHRRPPSPETETQLSMTRLIVHRHFSAVIRNGGDPADDSLTVLNFQSSAWLIAERCQLDKTIARAAQKTYL